MTKVLAPAERKPRELPLVIAILIVGAIIFGLPFVNLVSTSIKLDSEMAPENFTLLPKTPVPQAISPYARRDLDEKIKRPADMTIATWDALRPRFTERVREYVTTWWDQQSFTHAAFATVDRTAAIEAVSETLGARALNRLSDTSRKEGPDAMLAELPRLLTADGALDAFDSTIPRFILGAVNVRLTNYSRWRAGDAADWRVVSGPASLVQLSPPIVKPGQHAALLRYDFSKSSAGSLTVRLVPPAAAPASTATAPGPASLPRLDAVTQAGNIDRVYVSFRPDQSWARIQVRIIQGGRRYDLAEPVYAATLKSLEMEFRIPGKEAMPLSGRSFYLLSDAGPAAATDPPFAVDLSLIPSGAIGAWWAKISRNYFIAFRQVPIARYIATSISLAILSIILTVFGSSLSAYAFARIQFPGSNFLFGLLLATMMVPGQVTMIPNFLIFRSIGWYNTLYPLWVPAIFGSAFYIFLIRQFFLSVPKELEEAARIDGCGFLRIYWHIMLPLIRPTLVTVAIFAFMGSWNDFMGMLIYVNDERLYNLAFGLFKFNLTSANSNGLLMAGSLVMILPIILLFFLFQRYFIQGIALTGVGGK